MAQLAHASLLHELANEGFGLSGQDTRQTVAHYADLAASSERPNVRVVVLLMAVANCALPKRLLYWNRTSQPLCSSLFVWFLPQSSAPSCSCLPLRRTRMSDRCASSRQRFQRKRKWARRACTLLLWWTRSWVRSARSVFFCLDAPPISQGRSCTGTIKQCFAASSKPRVCNHAARILGSLSRPFPAETLDTNIPSNLNHLPETSIVRCVHATPRLHLIRIIQHRSLNKLSTYCWTGAALSLIP